MAFWLYIAFICGAFDKFECWLILRSHFLFFSFFFENRLKEQNK